MVTIHGEGGKPCVSALGEVSRPLQAVTVGEGRGLWWAAHGKVAALGNSIKAAWGIEASLTRLHGPAAALFCVQLPQG